MTEERCWICKRTSIEVSNDAKNYDKDNMIHGFCENEKDYIKKPFSDEERNELKDIPICVFCEYIIQVFAEQMIKEQAITEEDLKNINVKVSLT